MNTSRTNSPIPPVALSSLPSSPYPSPISLPSVRLSKFARDNDALRSCTDSPTTLPVGDAVPVSPVLPSPSPALLSQGEPKPHIPRPPNAFLLYRSNFLAEHAGLKGEEKRQQELSRVIGQCWHMLPEDQKKYWHDQAAERLREHQRMYPGYKFTPAPRGSSRKEKGKVDEEGASSDRIRRLREKFTDLRGPALGPTRRRRPKRRFHTLPKDNETTESDPTMKAIMVPLPASTASSPMPSPSVSNYDMPPCLPPFFPEPSYPHIDLVGRQQPNYPAATGFPAYVGSSYPYPRLLSPALSSTSVPSSDGELAQQIGTLDISANPACNSYPSAATSSVEPGQLCYGLPPSVPLPDQTGALFGLSHPLYTYGSTGCPPSGLPGGEFLPLMCHPDASVETLPFFPFHTNAGNIPEFTNMDGWNFDGSMSSLSV